MYYFMLEYVIFHSWVTFKLRINYHVLSNEFLKSFFERFQFKTLKRSQTIYVYVSSQADIQLKTHIPSELYMAIKNCLERLRISYCKI